MRPKRYNVIGWAKITVLEEEDSPTLETQLKKLTEENQKLEETVTGLMKTIEDMTAQIRKMDATGKSNTMLISKLKKKLGIFYHDITIRPSIFNYNILFLTICSE